MLIATDCCVFVVGYQIFCGYSQISRAAKTIALWRRYEENVINYDYLKLKKQQYEKQYYALFLNQTQDIRDGDTGFCPLGRLCFGQLDGCSDLLCIAH